jgi:pimeloyl-ACP methyl ester carboxylesterase
MFISSFFAFWLLWFFVRADELEIAVNGEGLLWAEIPVAELNPLRGSGSRRYSAHYTHIYAPLLYDSDADRYGITSTQVRNSYFQLYLRKFQWIDDPVDEGKPVKHVLLVSGGPGESGDSWVHRIYQLFRDYGKSNVIFYVADHRGVYRSAGVAELRNRGDRRSWRKVGPSERIREADWDKNVIAFEESAGFPVVAMSCSNAARDLSLITRVLKRYAIPRTSEQAHNFYLHAQSYGTMVALRTLQLLPEAFDAVLLEGLASLEMVHESVKADYGILQACDEDATCRRLIRAPEAGIESAFDVRKMIKNMSKYSRNVSCRAYLHRQLGKHLYSSMLSFSDALQTVLYELLTDDFPYANDRLSDRYAGMLALPFIKNLYFCTDEARFQRQVHLLIKEIKETVRGLEPSKSKTHSSVPDSEFVRSYINVHEAFDLRAMKRNSYCQHVEFEDLGHQCVIYRAQVRKMEAMKGLTGRQDRFSARAASARLQLDDSAEAEEDPVVRRDALAQDLKQNSRRVSLNELLVEKDDADGDGSSSSDSDDEADSEETRAHKILFKGTNHKPHHKHTRTRTRTRKHNRKAKNELSKFLGIKKDKGRSKHGKRSSLDRDSSSSSAAATTGIVLGNRRYYYDLDELAYELPTTSARVYVVGGTLDMKTPSNTARRILDQIRAPQKHFFEVEKMGHTTHVCQGPIIQAFLADKKESMREAVRCLRQFREERKLDWAFSGEDWW